jgi:hypothetical protein
VTIFVGNSRPSIKMMSGQHLFKYLFLVIGIVIITLSACRDNSGSEYLIRVRDRVVTVMEFNTAFEIVKTAYDHHSIQSRAILNDARMRLLDQKIEEMILLERAEDIKVEVSEEELEKKIDEVKSNYPDDAFEQIFLEQAVSFQYWKKGLRTRLIMEKVIRRELGDKIEMTPEEIAAYYIEKQKERGTGAKVQKGAKSLDEAVIKTLRQKKTEDAYKSWIKKLRQEYKVEINKAEWEEICSS